MEATGYKLVFLLGAAARSPSMQAQNFRAQLQMIQMVINQLKISPNDFQIGVVVYSNDASVSIPIDSYDSRRALGGAVVRIRNPGVGGRIDMGFDQVNQMLTKFYGSSVPRRVIAFVDQDSEVDFASNVRQLENNNVDITMIGIGEAVNKRKLMSISSKSKFAADAADVADVAKDIIKELKDIAKKDGKTFLAWTTPA